VTTNQHPLRLNVGFLINQPIGTSRDFEFSSPTIHLSPDLDLSNFAGVARIGKTPQGLLVQAKFRGDIQMECVRCLEPANQNLKADFSELFAFSSREMTDSGLILPEDGHIDLEPLVRDYMIIEVPIQPLCKSDCKGLCPICGENLNLTTCEHQATRMP
jgi:uncharacterized protein